MNTVQEHYNNQLAAIYGWMAGSSEIAIKQNYDLLCQLGVDAQPKDLAIDLGAGLGFQSIPLAEMGFTVVAVDFCADLLAEWRDRAEKLAIRIVEDNILNFSKHIESKAALVVCMGDTITHLESFDAVRALIANIENVLTANGKLILTFRDYVSLELTGKQRFIPVKSDDSRILTCFLEYHPDIVEVHDLLYIKDGDRWLMHSSSYPKLRLDANWLCSEIKELGFQVVCNQIINGMICIVAQK
ncbi:methyltransferase domain-containing protein [Pseudanabaena sp. FACHB-1998]|uniref:class I SAM-dependent methyltransferase n=1 Tax=Pseudanabaena sp. FACHB-1998 TaxID=2692858 RepID=UPI00168059C3|nr:methyltransferase domain-containing protein [Pseudanabaena sp. FACHB-1998]MBD2178391.1 methyltransferase domain-containing protein [Pseudanabaena sp. FACHB-1998]